MSCSSSLILPSISSNGFRRFSPLKLDKSRVFMSSISVGSQIAAVDDALFADYKPTNAFLFPGQGAQAVGMGAEAQKVPAAAELYKRANEIMGFDLLDICINGPKEKLDSTVLSQPAIYVTSLAAVEILRAREGGQQIIDSVDVTCGLSLGEYTALAFTGAFRFLPYITLCFSSGLCLDVVSYPSHRLRYKYLDSTNLIAFASFEDGLKLVKLRGEAMQATSSTPADNINSVQDAADAAKSAMVSIIGLDSDKVQKLCDAANEEVDEANKVQIANFLCPGNYAVSGGVKGIEAVEAKAKSFKARMTVRLAVAGAFHTSFMNPAVSRLEAALSATEIRTPRIPVISNVDAQPHADPDTIKKILASQVTSPVQWETTIKTLLTKGLKKSYELGPGKVIAGIVKRMDRGAEIENIGA
uniref:Malonyl-CoA:ACP transacylase (MAT) domain-containing protein n=1 Tax=Solanum lycopersicum TaxID=4081 RepID=A0A3Q7ERM4_SOLLC